MDHTDGKGGAGVPDPRERFGGYAVMVTGAARGIGAATARRLAAEGARVLVTDVDEEEAERTAAGIEGAEALRCDVADQASVDAAVAHAVRAFGRLDVLVNNALGAVTPDRDLFEEEPDAVWSAQQDITFMGAVRCSRAALPHLAAADGRGAIVTIGSVNAEADFGGHAYSAAKAGLTSLTRTLAGDTARRGVRVNQINPGTIATAGWAGREEILATLASRVYPLGRVGTPEDIAAAVAFLASRDASWITGTVLRVDGGLLAVNTHFGEVVGEG
ncbi:SDR family NAD(P)-dependent oxidoreductase [Streptomyces sp. NPDC101490]|uniref:SDR family NAD(P)-dependent oxidoreductase n=1 Tax=Streptomyces sp. NPDC101490 TaxID=3366143 RepID=UPI00382F502B